MSNSKVKLTRVEKNLSTSDLKKYVSHKDFLSINKQAKQYRKSLGAIRSVILNSDNPFSKLKLECDVLRASKKNKALYEAIVKVVRYSVDKDSGHRKYNDFWTIQAVRYYLPQLLQIKRGSEAEIESANKEIDRIIKAKAAKKAAEAKKKAKLVDKANKVAAKQIKKAA